jgi:hypothetical protein
MSKSYTPTQAGDTRTLLPPTIVAFALTSLLVRVDWAGAETDVDSFKVYRRLNSESDFTQVATVDNLVTSYEDTDVEPSTEYIYRIVVVFVSGLNTFESDPSNESSATTYAYDPAILTVEPLSSSRISLAWSFVSDIEGIDFQVMRRAVLTEDEYSLITTIPYTEDSNFYTDESLTADTEYSYRIDAVRGDDTVPSNEAADTTQEISLEAHPSTSSVAINLFWSVNCDDNDGWSIQRSLVAGGPYTEIDTVALESSDYTDSTVTAETEYFYVVQPTSESADLGYSGETSATAPVDGGGGGGGGGTYKGDIYPPLLIGKSGGFINDGFIAYGPAGASLTLTHNSTSATRTDADWADTDVGSFIWLKTSGYDNIPVAAIRSISGTTATLSAPWAGSTVTVTSDGGETEYWNTFCAYATVGLIEYEFSVVQLFGAPIPYYSGNNFILRAGTNRLAIASCHTAGQLTLTIYNDILNETQCVPQAVIVKTGLDITPDQFIAGDSAFHITISDTNYVFCIWNKVTDTYIPGGTPVTPQAKYAAKFDIDAFTCSDVYTTNPTYNLLLGCTRPSKGIYALTDSNVGLWDLTSGDLGGTDAEAPIHAGTESPIDPSHGHKYDAVASFTTPLASGVFAVIGHRPQDFVFVEDGDGWHLTPPEYEVGILSGDSTDLSYEIAPSLPSPPSTLCSASGLGTMVWGSIDFAEKLYFGTTLVNTFAAPIYDVVPAPDGKFIALILDPHPYGLKAYLLDTDGSTISELEGGVTLAYARYTQDPEGILSTSVWSPVAE